MKKQRHHTRHRVGLILGLVGLIGTTTLMVNVRLALAQGAAASWSFTGDLNAARLHHTATLLPSGEVLVAGGFGAGGSTAELYDAATGSWNHTGNLNTARAYHTATLLPNGKVLVTGGVSVPCVFGNCSLLNSAELYEPTTGAWSNTSSLNTGRNFHTATLLPNGKVLVAGGFGPNRPGNSAELYDPTTGTWSSTGNLNTASSGYTATLLQNGKVLIAGGEGLSRAELYDPATGTWSVTGSLNTGREFHTATLLPNGKVLVTSGNSAELYDSSTGAWSSTGNLNTDPSSPTATVLPNGKVLVAGSGVNDDDSDFNTSELYDPATGTWSISAEPNTFRTHHTATLLPNGKVLIAGGSEFEAVNTAELYDPGTSSTPNLIDDAQFFVRQHFLDFLNREPDAAGLAFWTNEITQCGANASCAEAKRINVSAAFFLSIEFQQTGYLVYRIYKSAFGNLPGAPVPIRFSEFLPDAQQIGVGVVVNQPGWEAVLENNKQSFAADFVQRSRFTSAYPNSMTPPEFVDALFANAGVTPSSAERAAAINEFGLASTTGDFAARALALRRVAENSTLVQQEFNRAFVLMQYFGYLRRNPNDAPDTNFDGHIFWLTKLDQFNGNFEQAEMVKAFLVSTEYRQRFGQP